MGTAAPPLEERWDLGDLFPDDESLERARTDLAERILPTLERHRGRLAGSAAALADALDATTDAVRRLRLLQCYASLKSDQDIRRARYQAMRQGIELLATELAQRTAFLRPEILEIDPDHLEGLIATEPRLAPHEHFLHDLIRQRSHIRAPGEERIIADSGLLVRSPTTLHQVFVNAELPRPEIALSTGERVSLTPVNFLRHRTTPHRPDRSRVFSEYFGGYRPFRETLGCNLYAALKGNLFHARVRGYGSCLEAALDADNVPVGVYRNLIRQVRERLPLLHRYFRLRGRALGIETLEYSDLACGLTPAPPRRFSTDEARRLLLDGMAPLGEEYVRDLASAFGGRWIDWHPQVGKRSGAYATGWAYDVHPYVLLNYTGDYESVLTLAHEMGHAMHSHLGNRTQPFPKAEYPIFLAEVASTFNEALLLRQMLGGADPDGQRLLLGSYLDGIRSTLFRQVMFAEFELDIHERAERGEVLTGEKLSEVYLALLRDYHGHESGVMRIADEFAIEWTAIPHLYYNFYVYQYATGLVAAGALAQSVLEARDGARDRYLGLLAAGGSDYPLELLRRAGVDLESETPYREAFSAVEQALERLEPLLAPPPER